MKTILAFLACLSEYIIFCVIEAEFFYDKLGVFWKFFFMSILLSIMIITWKAIVGQKKEKDLNNSEHSNNPNQIKSIDDEINVPSRTMKKRERLIIALLSVWSFLNVLFFLTPFGYNVTFDKTYKFFPFTYDIANNDFSNFFDLRFYDYTELLFYVGGAWLMYLLSKKRVTEALAKLKIEITKNKDKLIIVSLCVWSFIHVYLFLTALGTKITYYDSGNKIYSQKSKFFPFTYDATNNNFNKYFDIRLYDYTELFIYVVGVWMIYFMYRYLKGSKLVS